MVEKSKIYDSDNKTIKIGNDNKNMRGKKVINKTGYSRSRQLVLYK